MQRRAPLLLIDPFNVRQLFDPHPESRVSLLCARRVPSRHSLRFKRNKMVIGKPGRQGWMDVRKRMSLRDKNDISTEVASVVPCYKVGVITRLISVSV